MSLWMSVKGLLVMMVMVMMLHGIPSIRQLSTHMSEIIQFRCDFCGW